MDKEKEVHNKEKSNTIIELDLEKVPKDDSSDLEEKECKLCLVVTKKALQKDLSCGHKYCINCLKSFFQNEIENKVFPVLCPNTTCRKEVAERDIRAVVTSDLWNKYETFSIKSAIEKYPNSFLYCPTPDCPYVFFQGKNDPGYFKCPTCKKAYCINCKVPYHDDLSCESYQKKLQITTYISALYPNHTGTSRLPDKSIEHRLFKKMLNYKNWKRCSNCRAVVSKTGGCMHMVCRCGHEFCYGCGEKFPCSQSCNAVASDDEASH